MKKIDLCGKWKLMSQNGDVWRNPVFCVNLKFNSKMMI